MKASPAIDSHHKRILEIPLEELVSCGLGFKAKLIKNTITWIKEDGLQERLGNMSAEAAIENLQKMKGIGDWTARIVMCDLSGNWSLYPFDDLAVRTWAARLWPDRNWSSNPRILGSNGRRQMAPTSGK